MDVAVSRMLNILKSQTLKNPMWFYQKHHPLQDNIKLDIKHLYLEITS